MRNGLVAGFIILALTMPTMTWAQSRSSSKGKRVKVGKTVYNFDEADILGNLRRPQLGEIVEPPEISFRKLLDLDESFLPEIERAVHEF